MALRNQPYIPLMVDDFQTDEKLRDCSAASVGVYIRIMCLMHTTPEYGIILLKQKHKQGKDVCSGLAVQMAKQFPFDEKTINAALVELIEENVLQLNGDQIEQKRMIKDNDISLKRAAAGSSGGKKTQSNNKFAKAKPKANTQANSVSVNEYVNGNEGVSLFEVIIQLIADNFPEIKIKQGATISSIMFQQLDNFFEVCPEFKETGHFQEYLEKIKKSEWLMEKASAPISLKWICNPDNCMDVYTGKYANRKKDETASQDQAAWDALLKMLNKYSMREITKHIKCEKTKAAIKKIGGISVVGNSTKYTQGKIQADFKRAFNEV
jgi:uncharacterized protein YdaU (DUF1376 family)